MNQDTCLQDGCDEPVFIRAACQAHYYRAWRAHDVESAGPRTRHKPLKHELTNIDEARNRGDCSFCGVGVRVRLRNRRGRSGWECRGPNKETTQTRRRRRVWNRYGITLAEYEILYQAQGGACALCGVAQDRLCIDHCHQSGAVRGLLCKKCNMGLGFLGDDLEGIKRAVRYLRRYG